jgi:hypothetical protein
MFNIDWFILRLISTPVNKRQPLRATWLDVLLSQVKALHSEFYTLITGKLYELQFTGQIIYLEHVLNDTFDNDLRGIWIDNTADNSARIFLWNKVEVQPNKYLFNKWNAVDSYVTNDHMTYQFKVYKALSNNSNVAPAANPLVWQYVMDAPLLFNREDYALYNTSFIVMVPVALVFDTNRMKALINKYKLAGKSYTIQTY